MTTPSSAEMRDLLSTDPDLAELCENMAQEIFQEQFQGDDLIDRIQDLMGSWQWLSNDDPDEDIRVECVLTDEVWTRIVSLLLMHMQDTRRDGGQR
jgi:hypothetical protein